jgi:hypothetical protein
MLARKVLEETYSWLTQGCVEESFERYNYAMAEIGDDSDWHREVKGYTIYESYVVKNNWVVALGKKGGKYPADRFDRDIVAIQIDPKKNNKELLEQNKYFYHSLIISLASGEIGTRLDGFFGSQISDLKIDDFIIQHQVVDRDFYGVDLQPLVVKKIEYDEEIVKYLADKISNILS